METKIGDGIVRTICSYCSVGCALDIQIVDGKATKVLPAKDYPVNLGRTCTKGFNLLKAYDSPDRQLYPELRQSDGSYQRIDWDSAATIFSTKFKQIQERHGKDSVAFISTGQVPFEEMAVLGVLAKFGMGIKHGDGNTRQCMASAVVAYKQSFGFDAPPFSYQDAEESDLLIFVGANPVIAHPIFWQRVKMNQNNPSIVCIDPRLTETAKEAILHLAIKPKSDLSLLYALSKYLIDHDALDKQFILDHTQGFDEMAKHVQEFSIERAERDTGIAASEITKLAQLIQSKKKVSFWWTMGVNQGHQGVRTAQAMINIALMTGNIGRTGTGANSLTGQCNAMGSRLFSNTSSLISGHDFAVPEHRQKVADALSIPVESIPDNAGKSYDQILSAVDDGSIKGLWIICTNPAHSWIDKHAFFETMKKLDFLVVQDIYNSTETMMIADLRLAAAGSTEKEGTLINSERRLGIVQKVMQAPGEALSDFDIFHKLAKSWGCEQVLAKLQTPDQTFEVLASLSKGRPCDISGISSRALLVKNGGIQWPWPQGANPDGPGLGGQHRLLFADGKFFHPDGKAKFLTIEPEPAGELPDNDYPFWLLTGRGTMHQWHTQTRTSKVELIKKMYPSEAYVEINPLDAQRLNLVDKGKVKVETRRGSILVDVAIKDSVQAGHIFLPMHYAQTNYLTYSSFDSFSRQPSYKIGAARLIATDGSIGG